MSGTDLIVAKIDQGRVALAEACSIPDVKRVADIAAAAETYARRQNLGREAEQYARELRLDAERKLGEILKETPKATGTRGQLVGRGVIGDADAALPIIKTLAELGIDGKTSSRAQRLADIPDEQFEAVKSGEMPVALALRALRSAERATRPLPTDTYRVVYADPPWSYGGAIPEDNYGRAEHHYPCMTIKELCDMPVRALASPDAVLFLWVTSPLLDECFPVIKAWGFEYKTSFVWDKVAHNFGHYNSVRHEFLLVCTRGSCTPDVPTLIDSVQMIERTPRHSEKPEQFRTIIDTLYPRGQRIELFARTKVENWDAWGNEQAA